MDKNKNYFESGGNESGGNVDDFYKKKVHKPDYKDLGRKDEKNSNENSNNGFDDIDDSIQISEWDAEEIEDKWYGIEREYRRQYPDLTDEDVNVEPNCFRQTLARIGRRRKKTSEEILDEIKNW